jgi:hypothetical protein
VDPISRGYYTTGELRRLLGIKDWQARRALDSLAAAGVPIPRVSHLCRLLPVAHLESLRAELQRRGWLPGEAVSA